MQHFPLFRSSDQDCHEEDEAPPNEKFVKMREKWDCVSKESSDFLLKLLHPRAIFDGHTHHGCFQLHGSEKIPEWTISSFSWRNRFNPTFALVEILPNDFEVSKCFLPTEAAIVQSYQMVGCVIVFFIVLNFFLRCKCKIRNNCSNNKVK